jgi:hypothetical protein
MVIVVACIAVPCKKSNMVRSSSQLICPVQGAETLISPIPRYQFHHHVYANPKSQRTMSPLLDGPIRMRPVSR